ncbi:cytochrome P450 [Streptomyces wuyuanensis]|uniref:cytochrome P450 n=1 Tax=Streptomyces wuyuanensis TaxID=1196353 RepID=UPI003442F051
MRGQDRASLGRVRRSDILPPDRAVRRLPRHGRDGAPRMTGSSVPPPVEPLRAPGGWPLLGHTVAFLRRPLETLTRLGSAGPLVYIRFGPIQFLMVNDPALVHHVALDADHFERGHIFTGLQQLFGGGLVTVDGEIHQRHRRMLLPAFQRGRIRNHADVIRHKAEETTESWQPGRQIAVDAQMADLAAASTLGCLFGSADATTLRAQTRIRRALPVVVRAMLRNAVLPTALTRMPTRDRRRYAAAVDELHDVVRHLIWARRTQPAVNDDILSLLLTARDENGDGLSDQQIHDEVLTLLLAGSDTTGMALAWAFHELSRNPKAEQELRVELDTVLGTRPVSVEDLPHLKHARAVITEVLRLYPVPLITRRVRIPTVLGTAALKAGSEVAYSPWALHHNPRLFPEPERFDPSRWRRSQPKPSPGSFIPFGEGPHRCIGESFAITMTTVALATIAARWRLRPCPGHVRPVAGLTIHPNQLPMITVPRQPGG